MTTYNTGNPLGSADPRDLYDNAENLDHALNSDADTWKDRLGTDRKTFRSAERAASNLIDVVIPDLEASVEASVEDTLSNTIPQIVDDFSGKADASLAASERRWEGKFNQSQDLREQQFATFIASSGYQFAGDYAAGIEITQYNQLVRDGNGEFWRVTGQVDLPYVTTGAGIPEGGTLVPVGDAMLRSDIKSGRVSYGNITSEGSYDRGGVSTGNVQITLERIRPVISFIDDDGNKAFLTRLKPIYDEKGIKSGIAVMSASPGVGARAMDWGEIRGLQAEGHEILSHLVTHVDLNTLGMSEIDKQLKDSKRTLELNGLRVESMVYPYGRRGVNRLALSLVAKYYRAGFRTNDSRVGLQYSPLEDFRIVRFDTMKTSVEANPSLEQLKAVVDNIEAANDWGVFTTHAAFAGNTPEQQQVLSDLIDYIRSKNIEIMVPREALNIHGSKLLAVSLGGDEEDELRYNKYFKIDKHGEAHPKRSSYETIGDRNEESKISEYLANCTTTFRTSSGQTWAGRSDVGVVETIRVTHVGEFGLQRFTPINKDYRAYRTWDSSGEEWSEWTIEESNYRGLITSSDVDPETYPDNSTTMQGVTSNATGFPNTPGVLITTKQRSPNSAAVTYQEYTVRNSEDKFVRFFVGGSWTEFKSVVPQKIEAAPTSDTPVTSFEEGTTTLSIIPGYLGYPANPALLETEYYVTGSTTYGKQTVKAFLSKVIFTRVSSTDGNGWGEWERRVDSYFLGTATDLNDMPIDTFPVSGTFTHAVNNSTLNTPEDGSWAGVLTSNIVLFGAKMAGSQTLVNSRSGKVLFRTHDYTSSTWGDFTPLNGQP